MNLFHYPHRRFNALTGEWILVSPQRTNRPWQGSVEEAPEEKIPPYDPKCYLCPGNERAGGAKNPKYKKTFVFTNDFSALLEDIPTQSLEEKNLFKTNTERGKCKVICFSPRHDLTLALMENADIKEVIDVWINQCKESEDEDFINYVQIHYLPPLLRSATIKKFMVGYELLAMPQRDITAEHSAQRLRDCSEIHCRHKSYPD